MTQIATLAGGCFWGVQELLRQRDAIRLRSTDDTRATEALAALPWVERVEAREKHLLITAPLERAWELSAALAAQQGHEQRDHGQDGLS
jgi:hypothetical protein